MNCPKLQADVPADPAEVAMNTVSTELGKPLRSSSLSLILNPWPPLPSVRSIVRECMMARRSWSRVQHPDIESRIIR